MNTIQYSPEAVRYMLHRHISTHSLRSSDAPKLVVPRIRTELARRAFPFSAPSAWNCLLDSIPLCKTVPTCKKHLKNIRDISRAFMSP